MFSLLFQFIHYLPAAVCLFWMAFLSLGSPRGEVYQLMMLQLANLVVFHLFPSTAISYLVAPSILPLSMMFLERLRTHRPPRYNALLWIIIPVTNEDIAGITKVGECQLSDFFPWFMSEIKSLYIIPDDPRVTTNAVKIYLYTHTRFSTESNKGLRRTYFQGFNQASTFKTEDYSIIPPMTDFRRTIWWQPNIITDAQGKAKVEFFNNSTCEEMYISVEGMTPEGKVLVND